jgi:ribonucleoside-diphosphate reductase alpha chain
VVDEEFWERAGELLDLIAENAWKSGDPGFLFIDNMRKYSPFNPKKYGEHHDPAFSNPCGEYLAPAFTSCNLITVNVAKIAKECVKRNKEFDFNEFFKRVARYGELAVYLGSYLVQRNDGYPIDLIRERTQEVRPVGVGMTGFHTAMLLAYDGDVVYGRDEESIRFARMTQASLTIGTLTASSILAKKTGIVYEWNPEYLELHLNELREVVEKEKLPLVKRLNLVEEVARTMGGFYNSVTTSQPPTGSVSQFARVGGDTGIEPTYAIELQRRVRDFYTNTWKTVTVVTEYLIDRLEDENFRKKVERQLAYEIKPEEQIAVLEALQQFVHTGISKTINVPENTSVEDLKRLIVASRNARLKGFTVFRENCRVDTVYVSPARVKKEEEKEKDDLPPTRSATVYEVRGTVNAYVTTTFDDSKRIREVFITVGKAGTTLNGMFQAFGRIMSVALRRHPELINRFIQTLEGIETGEFYSCNGIFGRSLPDVIAKILKKAMEDASAESRVESEFQETGSGDLCPACGKLTYYKNGNCKTCKSCGYTTC